MRVVNYDLSQLVPFFTVPLAQIDAAWPERIPAVLARVGRLDKRLNPLVHLSKLDILTIVNVRRARMDHDDVRCN